MPTSEERRTAILLLLDERHRRDPSTTVDDTGIAAALTLDLQEVRRQLDILESQGLTKPANTHEGHSAWISARGMEAADRLREAAGVDTPAHENSRPAPETVDARAVWVVSGRNDAARTAMVEFLRALDLKPVEWDHAVASTSEGSPFIGGVIERLAETQAIIVLLTGDDYVQLHPMLAADDDPLDETLRRLQPRPNVIFEAGMSLGSSKTSERTILVQIGKPKLFSNIAGRHVVKMSNSAAARNALVSRLSTAGCAVNTISPAWLSAGDFDSPLLDLPLETAGPQDAKPRPIMQVTMRFLFEQRRAVLQITNTGEEAVFFAYLRASGSLPAWPIEDVYAVWELAPEAPASRSVRIATGATRALLLAERTASRWRLFYWSQAESHAIDTQEFEPYLPKQFKVWLDISLLLEPGSAGALLRRRVLLKAHGAEFLIP